MIDDGIKNKIYEQRADNTLRDLKIFQDFSYIILLPNYR